MPDHVHLIVTPSQNNSLERAMQFLKGRFSFVVKRELGNNLEIWEKSFTNHRIRDIGDYERYREYIRQNPVKRGLVDRPEDYPYSSARSEFELDGLRRLKPDADWASVSHR